MRILIVEDETTLADALREAFERESYAVDLAPDAAAADELVSVNAYDLAVLDRHLPAGVDGLDLLEGWRGRGWSVPVLVLTARGALDDRVEGLDRGADDYLAKPFAFEELFARVRSLLRRREKALVSPRVDDVELDREARSVVVAGERHELTAKEFGVLDYLLHRVDETVTRAELAEHVWDDGFDAMSNVIDVIVYRVRKKIDGGRDGKLLHTIKGVGYRLAGRRS